MGQPPRGRCALSKPHQGAGVGAELCGLQRNRGLGFGAACGVLFSRPTRKEEARSPGREGEVTPLCKPRSSPCRRSLQTPRPRRRSALVVLAISPSLALRPSECPGTQALPPRSRRLPSEDTDLGSAVHCSVRGPLCICCILLVFGLSVASSCWYFYLPRFSLPFSVLSFCLLLKRSGSPVPCFLRRLEGVGSPAMLSGLTLHGLTGPSY